MAFCIIDKNLIDHLVLILKNKKVLEVCSGKGELSKALQEHGVDIKPTGKLTKAYDGFNPVLSCEIEDIDAVNAARKYRDDYDIILVSWAIVDDSFLQAAIVFNKPIVFIGELYHKHSLNKNNMYSSTATDNYYENVIDLKEPIKLKKGYLFQHKLKEKIKLIEPIILNFYSWNNKFSFEEDIISYNQSMKN